MYSIDEEIAMIRLEKINGGNVWDILALKVRDDQKTFVAANDKSIIEAYIAVTGGAAVFPFGIYDGETPVGFVMISFGDAWDEPPQIAFDNYCIWRFMVDERYQGRGYGRQALQLALEFVRSRPCGDAECCWLSYEQENAAAKKLYHSFGFRETGESDGSEVIAAVKL